jgi:hypothetical protein
MTTKTDKYTKVGFWTAILSFIIGTIMIGFFYFTLSIELAVYSYSILIAIALFNVIVLSILMSNVILEKVSFRKYRLTVGLMIANIPVAIGYFVLVLILINTLRITFVNSTGERIDNIEIIGCEPKLIDNLEPEDSKTVWINITGDSTLEIEYQLQGETKREIVFGYVTNSNGQIATYWIGKDKKPIDERGVY